MLAAPAVVLLAPLAALVRTVQARRRGREPRVRIGRRDGTRFCRQEVRLDVAAAREGPARLRVTETLVRVAEALRSPDDSYHLVCRLRPDEPARLRAIGPLVQELGDHVALMLGRPAVRHHTLLWLALARAQRLGGIVDAATADPDAAGEPEGLVAASGPRWAAATAVAGRGPSVLFHVAVWTPPGDAGGHVEAILRRLVDELS